MSVIYDKIRSGQGFLGLQSVKEPMHMTTAIISPCGKCRNKHCIRRKPKVYKQVSEDFHKVMDIRAHGNIFSPFISGRENYRGVGFLQRVSNKFSRTVHNPVSYKEDNIRGMVFAFVALPTKNLILEDDKLMFAWDQDGCEHIQCEPFPVTCMLSLKHVQGEFSGEVSAGKWVHIFHTGDTVHTGVFMPTVVYGQDDDSIVTTVTFSERGVTENI